MNSIQFSIENNKLIIEGFPDGLYVAKLPLEDPMVRQLQSLALAHVDMEDVLNSLSIIHPGNNNIINRALFESALVKFYKNFTKSASRIPLKEGKVFKAVPKEARKGFLQYKALRDKHIVHDENLYADAIVIAIINSKDAAESVPQVGINIFISELYNTHAAALIKLASATLDWIKLEIDALCDKLKAQYNALEYKELLNLEPASYTAPGVNDLYKDRNGKSIPALSSETIEG